MNQLALIQAFIATAEQGSVKEAAKQLHQTDAAISRKLSKLESDLAVQLLSRQRSGIVLTSIGQAYYHQVKAAVSTLDEAQHMIRQTQQQPQGSLTVVANEYYAKQWLLPRLSHFQKHYPKIDLRIEVAEVLPDFDAYQMDILYGVAFGAAEAVVQKRLTTTHYVLCASPQYLTEHPPPTTPSELLAHDYIGHHARPQPGQIQFNDETTLQLKPQYLFNSSELLIQAALNHLGIIYVHKNQVQPLIDNQQLTPILESYTNQPINVYLFYPYRPYPDNNIQAFVSWFGEVDHEK